MKLCECGCEERVVKQGNRFIFSHHRRNIKLTKKQKRKQSESMKGNQNTLGYKHTKQTKEKMRKAAKKRWQNSKYRKKNKTNTGYKHTKKTKIKMKKAQKGNQYALGCKHTKEMNKANSKRMKGNQYIKKYWSNLSKEERRIRTKNWREASLKASPSSIEKMIWRELDNLNIKYKTQFSLNKHQFVADIYISDKNLIIECNGNYYHNYKIFPKKKIRDDKLQKYCNKNKINLIWLWETEIREDSQKALRNGLKQLK